VQVHPPLILKAGILVLSTLNIKSYRRPIQIRYTHRQSTCMFYTTIGGK